MQTARCSSDVFPVSAGADGRRSDRQDRRARAPHPAAAHALRRGHRGVRVPPPPPAAQPRPVARALQRARTGARPARCSRRPRARPAGPALLQAPGAAPQVCAQTCPAHRRRAPPQVVLPPTVSLSAEKLDPAGAYLMDNSETMSACARPAHENTAHKALLAEGPAAGDFADSSVPQHPAAGLLGSRALTAACRLPPPLRTKWTRRVPHPVLIEHAASLTRRAGGARFLWLGSACPKSFLEQVLGVQVPRAPTRARAATRPRPSHARPSAGKGPISTG